MRNTRMSGRARNIAACTAIAIAAGALFASPALADAKGPTAPKAATAAKAKPRFDLDGDGKGDIVARTEAGLVTYRNDNGNYVATPLLTDLPHAEINRLITPGDLDGDGKPDVLWTDPAGNLFALTNAGGTAKPTVTRISSGWNMYDKVVSVGDLTGDGKNDLIAVTRDGDAYLFAGTGNLNAPFAPAVKVASGWGDYDQIVGVTDADGDGIGDLYVRTVTDDLLFIGGTGDAAKPFKAPVALGAGWHSYNQLLSADDQDGDGLSDLLARTESGDLYLYKALGNGRFADPVKTGSGWQAAAVLGNAGGRAAVGKDKFLTKGAHFVNEYRSVKNDGQFGVPTPWPAGVNDDQFTVGLANALNDSGEPSRLQVADGRLWIDGPGQQQASLGKGWDAYTTLFGPGDLNGDGHGDLLAVDKAGVLWEYLGDGSGSKFAERIQVGSSWQGFDKVVGSGDINGDGRADVVARAKSGHLFLFPGTGDPRAPFGTLQDLGGGWNAYTKLAAVADDTGNGTTDLIAIDASGQGFRYDGQGRYGGKFKPAGSLGGGWNAYTDLF
ncbi:FG-GAP-like repeat-containing protein [Streptomyces sp. NPDC052000]|uniref:FG-GAP-like repeat-containing protein n=1 Tax=Streptomyces sp. NPDC052000 TaxID=3155676 RepID=UPI00344DB05A